MSKRKGSSLAPSRGSNANDDPLTMYTGALSDKKRLSGNCAGNPLSVPPNSADTAPSALPQFSHRNNSVTTSSVKEDLGEMDVMALPVGESVLLGLRGQTFSKSPGGAHSHHEQKLAQLRNILRRLQLYVLVFISLFASDVENRIKAQNGCWRDCSSFQQAVSRDQNVHAQEQMKDLPSRCECSTVECRAGETIHDRENQSTDKLWRIRDSIS